jgi:hypothetical protein
MPGSYVSYLQNGHCYFPAPWLPPGKTSLPEPLPNSIPQYDALGMKAKPVVNIDNGGEIRTQVRLPWTPDEDLRLVS